MKSPYSSVDSSNFNRVHLVVYIVLEVIIGTMIVVALCLNWFNYCYWEFGIYEVDFIDSDLKGFDDPDTITEVQTNSCDDYETTLNRHCNDFCDNIAYIKAGSDVMLVLSCFTLVCILTTLVFYTVRLFYRDYRFRILPFITILQSFVYILSVSLYVIILDFNDYDDPEGCDDSCDDYTMKSGTILSFANAGVLFAFNIYGFIFTRKAFI